MLRRSLIVLLLMFALAGAAVSATFALRPQPSRDIVLVARGMAFYLDGRGEPNPVIRVRPGERVRIVLRNEAKGLQHDFAVPAVGVALEPVSTGGSRAASFTAPQTPGARAYLCRPHSQMMRGTLLVAEP